MSQPHGYDQQEQPDSGVAIQPPNVEHDVPPQHVVPSQEIISTPETSVAPSSEPPPEPPIQEVSPSEPTSDRIRGWTITDWSSTIEEDGRTYQGYMPGQYSLPNDGAEQDRQDFQHAIYDMILNGKLAAAPIGLPRQVLDIGTGTGIWAIDFAEQYPTSSVTGTDLSVIQGQPRTSNCQFVLENSETQDWLYPFQFDYIHLRSTGPCFKDMGLVLKRAFDHMSPGGWIEFQEGGWEIARYDNNGRESAYEYWLQLIKAGAAAAGHDLAKMRHYDHYLMQAGFTEVKKQTVWVPLTPWAKGYKMQRLGSYICTTMTIVVDSFRKYLVLAGLGSQDIDDLSAAVKRDLCDTSFHFVVPTYIVYGQKPQLERTVSPEVKVECEP